MSYPSRSVQWRQPGTSEGELKQHHSQKFVKMRSNPLYKALDAVATTPLRAGDGGWRQALDPRVSNYDRVAALVALCDRLAPGLAQRWSRRLFDGATLPLAGARCTPYAFGSGATVFRLQGGVLPEPGLILKVYRRTLGREGRHLLQLAHFLSGKYATVCRWYAGGGIYIAPSSYFIFNAPLLGAPAVGMVQPFVAREMKDLFLDFSNEALLSLMARDAGLAHQLRFFCRRTLDVVTQEGRCLDFVGRDNVCVLAPDAGEAQLAIVDFGIFDLEHKREQAPGAYDEVMMRVERLETLLRASDAITSGNMAAANDAGQR